MASDNLPIHSGHRTRMRSRLSETGLEGFQPHEVLELLLYCVIPKRDVNPLAHALLEEFGTLDAVLSASPEALSKTPGVGEQTAGFFAALNKVCEDYREACAHIVPNPLSIGHTLRRLPETARHSLKRNLTVFFADLFGRPLCVHSFPGRPNDPAIIRSVLSKALALHCHTVVIFCTGYRSAPSLTKQELDSLHPLADALAGIDAFVIDFILLSDDHLLSLRKENLLSGHPTELQRGLSRWDHWLGPIAHKSSETRWYPLALFDPE